MSGYKLNTYVHAVELDANGAQTGRARMFGPADDLNAPENDWALTAITNPNVWDGAKPPRREPPAPISGNDEVAQLKARIAELEAAQQPSETPAATRTGARVAKPAKPAE